MTSTATADTPRGEIHCYIRDPMVTSSTSGKQRRRQSLSANQARFWSCNDARKRKRIVGFARAAIVWIKWIGAHKDYDRIDVKEVQHGG